MRPDVKTQIQRTKGIRQPADLQVDTAAFDQWCQAHRSDLDSMTPRSGREIANGILAGVAAPATITGQFDVKTCEAEAPARVDEIIAARTLMMEAMSKAHYTVRDNGDGTFTHSYRFECAA